MKEQIKKQKRALTIHDISCIGRCSITVALPILSAAGVDTGILPTSVLSTHTGGFEGYTFRDLTDDMPPIIAHWKSLGLEFDAIYTGFLGSSKQVDMVIDILNTFGQNALKVIDPAMADNGALYPTFSSSFPGDMRRLCSKADIIVPNFTEAALLLEEEYIPAPYTREYVEDILKRLGKIGAKQVVLTGVAFDSGRLGAASYNVSSGDISYYFTGKVPGVYHGSGDVFASALTGALLREKSLHEAAQIAVETTYNAVKFTSDLGQEKRYGVAFELALPGYIDALKNT